MCFSRQDVPEFAPYHPAEPLDWRTSHSGGKRNSLAWTLKAVEVDTRGVLTLAGRLKSLFKATAEQIAWDRAESAAKVPAGKEVALVT